jgi:hypothetical protein
MTPQEVRQLSGLTAEVRSEDEELGHLIAQRVRQVPCERRPAFRAMVKSLVDAATTSYTSN